MRNMSGTPSAPFRSSRLKHAMEIFESSLYASDHGRSSDAKTRFKDEALDPQPDALKNSTAGQKEFRMTKLKMLLVLSRKL